MTWRVVGVADPGRPGSTDAPHPASAHDLPHRPTPHRPPAPAPDLASPDGPPGRAAGHPHGRRGRRRGHGHRFPRDVRAGRRPGGHAGPAGAGHRGTRVLPCPALPVLRAGREVRRDPRTLGGTGARVGAAPDAREPAGAAGLRQGSPTDPAAPAGSAATAAGSCPAAAGPDTRPSHRARRLAGLAGGLPGKGAGLGRAGGAGRRRDRTSRARRHGPEAGPAAGGLGAPHAARRPGAGAEDRRAPEVRGQPGLRRVPDPPGAAAGAA